MSCVSALGRFDLFTNLAVPFKSGLHGSESKMKIRGVTRENLDNAKAV